MKKIILITVLALLSAVCAMGFSAKTTDGVELGYTITSSTAPYTVEVSGCPTSATTVTIPSTVIYDGTTYSVTSIGEWAFYVCRSLTSVTIPNSVTSIGWYAFGFCSSLKDVTIPGSVTSIEGTSFDGTAWLENQTGDFVIVNGILIEYKGDGGSVTIPNSVTTIGNNAFYSCDDLTKVTIPNSVTSIGKSAFSGCDGLKEVTIPNSVTSIGNNAFYSCDVLTSVTIPSSVTSIADMAFSCCDGLTKVTIPGSVTSIGAKAFYSCDVLTTVTIPSSVTSIGDEAFSETAWLKNQTGDFVIVNGILIDYKGAGGSVTIPSSVTSIADMAFSDCDDLTGVVVSASNPNYSSKDGILYNKDQDTLIVCPAGKTGSVTIPNSVTVIGDYAFYECKSLTGVTIPNSVTTIGSNAFYYCKSLTGVTIPNSVTVIGDKAFGSCGLKGTLTIPNSVTTIGDYAFNFCRSLTEVTIPNSVTSIGEWAFRDCSGLTEVTIPGSVTSIGEYAFFDCDDLTEVTMLGATPPAAYSHSFSKPATVTVPYGCKEAYNVDGDGEWQGLTIAEATTLSAGDMFNYQDGSGYVLEYQVNSDGTTVTCMGFANGETAGSASLVIPDKVTVENDFNVTGVSDKAFYNENITGTLTIGNNVTSIGDSAFYSCNSLTDVTIGNNVTSIGDRAFYSCGGLTEVTIPNSVTSIEKSAFNGCSGLKGTLTIPNSVTSIGDYAFYGCESLTEIAVSASNTNYSSIDGILYNKAQDTLIDCPDAKTGSVTIPNSVKSIGRSAFSKCSVLTEVTIGNSVKSIGDWAFNECKSLTGVTIPNSVTSIGKSAFYKCSVLTEVTIGNSVKSMGDYAFCYCESLTEVTIPDSVTTIGEQTFRGCSELTEVTIGNSVKSIGDYAFYECKSLTDVAIPDSVTSIGKSAFYKCSGLTEVTIGNSVTSIGSSAFQYCKSLTGVTIGNSVTTIGVYAFYYCESLTDVTIPNSVTKIWDWAFQYCKSLTDVTIGNSVTTIRYYAFSYCESLTGVTNNSTVPQDISSTVFYGLERNEITLYVPKASIEAYKAKSVWKDFKIEPIVELSYEINNDGTTVTCTGFANDDKTAVCRNLVIPSTVEIEGKNYSVTNIGDVAFFDCSGLTGTLTIPGSVTNIGWSAFDGCSGLTEFVVSSNNANYLSLNGILYNKTQENLIACPASKTGNVTIPNSVTTIEEGAFKGCGGLTAVTIPGSVTSIGYMAFYDCDGLIEVTNNATEPQNIEGSDVFPFKIYETTLYVPEASIEAYEEAAVWQDFKSVEKVRTTIPIENITIDLDSTFTQIDLLDYFVRRYDTEIQFVASSNKPEVVSVTINDNKFGIIPRLVGIANISIVAESESGIEDEINFKVIVTTQNNEINECKEFVINETVTDIQCPGDEIGSIELEVSGNTAPYKYRWSNTQTSSGIYNLAAGKYSVIIRDAMGCAETKIYEVQGSDSIKFEQTIVNPGCGLSDGSISVNVTGGTKPYTYRWNNIASTFEMTEIPSGIYNLVVKDANGCEHSEAIALNSEDAPEIIVDLIKNPKCGVKQGEIHVSVNGGTPPYNHTWSDGGTGLNRTELIDTVYTLEVTDQNNCKANLIAEIKSLSFLKPDIGLVTVDRTTGNNLIIWQKEKTEGIEKYNIYREDTVTKNYDFIGSWDYNEISVYEDTEVDPNESSWRYKLQAENNCDEKSQLSNSFKTMHIKGAESINQDGVLLYWDDYEGEEFPTYSLYRLFDDRSELITTVPSHTTYYFDKTPLTEKVRAYFVAVELPEEFDVTSGSLLKAESGPFSLALSNIAEVEISTGIENISSAFSQILVYPTISKDVVNVTVGAGQQAQVTLYTLTGEKVYEQEVLETTELNVSNVPNGVYTVVVTIDGVGYGYKIIVK